MSVIGIVCEFNPFHSGHQYLIESVKKNSDDVIVAVMSGNFVQRGEPAIFPKEIRTKAALLSGVDIVIELPFLYATSSAETFAESAVRILDAMGCEKIAFGTENTDLKCLNETVEAITSNNFSEEIKKYLKTGVSYPTARQVAFNNYKIDCNLALPNNILAVEYLKAIKKINSKMIPVPVSRVGAGYNDDFALDGVASATHIRKIIYHGEDFAQYVPQKAYSIYCDAIKFNRLLCPSKYDVAMMALLRNKLRNDMSGIANMAEGLDNRIKISIIKSTDLKEVYDSVKTKRYTYSRGRRSTLSYAFEITKEDLQITPPYCRLMGFKMDKSKILGNLARHCKLPFVASYSDIEKIKMSDAERVFELENISTDIFNLSLTNSEKCSTEMTFSPVKIR